MCLSTIFEKVSNLFKPLMSSILLKNKGITLFYSYGGTSNYEVFKNDTSKATRSLQNNSGIIIPRVSLS